MQCQRGRALKVSEHRFLRLQSWRCRQGRREAGTPAVGAEDALFGHHLTITIILIVIIALIALITVGFILSERLTAIGSYTMRAVIVIIVYCLLRAVVGEHDVVIIEARRAVW